MANEGKPKRNFLVFFEAKKNFLSPWLLKEGKASMKVRMEKGQRRKRNFRKLFHGTVGRLKPRGMATLDMYSASKSVFTEKGTKLNLKVAL